MNEPDRFEEAIASLKTGGAGSLAELETLFLRVSASLERASEAVRQVRLEFEAAVEGVAAEYRKLKERGDQHA